MWFLKSKAIIGGVLMIALGVIEGAAAFRGKAGATLDGAGQKILLGLGIVGVRHKQEKDLPGNTAAKDRR